MAEATTIIDISGEMEMKAKLLGCHASQREWLAAHHGMDAYIEAMKQIGAERGKLIGAKYAEGFVQYRPHAYPQGDLLAELFGKSERHGRGTRATMRRRVMAKKLTMLNTIQGSLLEGFYPRGWDLGRIDKCCGLGLKRVTQRGKWWHKDFSAVTVKDVAEMDRKMGDAIADEIEQTRKRGQELAIILPVGPMGMYKTVVQRIKASEDAVRPRHDVQHGRVVGREGQHDARRPAGRVRARDGRGAVRAAGEADGAARAAELRDAEEPADVRRRRSHGSRAGAAGW